MPFESYRFQRAVEAGGEGKADGPFYWVRTGPVQPSPSWSCKQELREPEALLLEEGISVLSER